MGKKRPAASESPRPEDRTTTALYAADALELKQLAVMLVRTIRVPAPALPALVAAVGGRTSGPLFATSNGRRFPAQNIDGGLRRLLRSLGLPVRGSHTLRHAVGSHLAAAGVSLADVAKYLGDDVATVVRTYMHAVGADPADAMERLHGGNEPTPG